MRATDQSGSPPAVNGMYVFVSEPGTGPAEIYPQMSASASAPFYFSFRTVKRYGNAQGTGADGRSVAVDKVGEPRWDPATGQFVHTYVLWGAPLGPVQLYLTAWNGSERPDGKYVMTNVTSVRPCPRETFESGLTTRRTKRGVQIYASVSGVFSGKCPISFTARLITTVDGKRRVVTARRRAVPITQYGRNVVYPSRVIYLLYPKGKRRPNPVVTVDYQVSGSTKPFALKRQTKTIG